MPVWDCIRESSLEEKCLELSWLALPKQNEFIRSVCFFPSDQANLLGRTPHRGGIERLPFWKSRKVVKKILRISAMTGIWDILFNQIIHGEIHKMHLAIWTSSRQVMQRVLHPSQPHVHQSNGMVAGRLSGEPQYWGPQTRVLREQLMIKSHETIWNLWNYQLVVT